MKGAKCGTKHIILPTYLKYWINIKKVFPLAFFEGKATNINSEDWQDQGKIYKAGSRFVGKNVIE